MATARELIASPNGADALTTTAVADRLGIAVATVYRYFGDRYEIVAALIDRETRTLNARIDQALERRESVSLNGLIDVLVEVHLEYFRDDPTAVVIWHEFREGQPVMDRIRQHYRELGAWVARSTIAAELIIEDAPRWPVETAIWLCDQSFGVVFAGGGATSRELLLIAGAKEVLKAEVSKYANPDHEGGVPLASFFVIAGRLEDFELDPEGRED
ncbi:MAG: TetR/AcrR family transcriptional regulator [Solirubrobacterales bacterium]